MSVDFSDWSAAQTPVVTILILAAIGVVAGVVCRLVLRQLYPLGYGQIGEPVASVMVGLLVFLVAFAICMSLAVSPGGRPSDFDGALAASYGFESVDCGNGSRRNAIPDGTEYCIAERKGGKSMTIRVHGDAKAKRVEVYGMDGKPIRPVHTTAPTR